MPEQPAKEESKKRLFATLLLQGTLTILSIKQDLPTMTEKRNLVQSDDSYLQCVSSDAKR